MIESMDDAVGTLLDTLDRLEIADNTIIIFASDNGGNMYNEVDGTTPTSNAPLRGGKATMYEGGVRGPAIVVWPGHVRSRLAQRRGDPEQRFLSDPVGDAGRSTATRTDVRRRQHRSGLARKVAGARRDLHLFSPRPRRSRLAAALGQRAQGDWKLIRIFHGGENGQHRWKLFNLRDDIGEQHDLADEFPARVQELDARDRGVSGRHQGCRAAAESQFRPYEISAGTGGQR